MPNNCLTNTAQNSVILIGCGAISTAFNIACTAAGMATLDKAGYEGYSADYQAILATVVGASLFFSCFCACALPCIGMDTEEMPLLKQDNAGNSVITIVASVVLAAMTGQAVTNATGLTSNLGLGQAAAAAAVGGAEICGGIIVMAAIVGCAQSCCLLEKETTRQSSVSGTGTALISNAFPVTISPIYGQPRANSDSRSSASMTV